MLLSNKAKGYILGAIAAATYGMNPLFALPLYADGMDADSVLFFRYMMAIPVMGLLLRIRGHSFSLASGRLAELAVLGVVVALSSLLLFLSYNYMDSGVASTLLFVYPVMVALIMAFRYGERLPPVTVVCIAVTLVGIMMLNRTAAGAGLSATGIWMVMLSSAAYAVYIVAITPQQPPYRESNFLCASFRCVGVCGAYTFQRSAYIAVAMVYVGLPFGFGVASNCCFFLLHHAVYSIHRAYPDCHFGSFGTCCCHICCRGRVWRHPYAAPGCRYGAYPFGRYCNYCRRTYNAAAGAFQKAFPENKAENVT